MKKTTKILLVLAAVVAMTIGAVSTVMAADEYEYATIGEWITVDASKKIYKANDVNGDPIVRGWAVEDGYWYFFDSSLMLVNTFVTWNEEVYYLDGNGHMAIGWIGFDAKPNDAKHETIINTVDKHEKKTYADISKIRYNFNGVFAIDTEDAVGAPLFDGELTGDDVMWCYFDEHGVMAQHEWVQTPDELWYFIYGAYCVLDDYQVAIDLGDTAADKWLVEDGEGFYGFAADGHMLVGWEEYRYATGSLTTGKLTDDDTPYEDKGADTDNRGTTLYGWTYYHTNGRQVNTTKDDPKNPFVNAPTSKDIYEGWEKIGEEWCYFIQDDILGMILLTDDFVYDANTDVTGKLEPNKLKGTFYVDEDGYLVRGLQTFPKNDEIGTWEEKLENSPATSGAIKFAADAATFMFGQESGNMLYGIQSKYYFLTRKGEADYVYIVDQSATGNIPETGKVTLTQATFDKDIKGVTGTDMDYVEGQRIDGKNFFVVVDEAVLGINWDADNNTNKVFIYYFESGVMQRNQAITFGEVTIAIDANGCVVTAAGTDNKVTVAGHQFILEPGVDANSIALDGYVIPGLKK